MKKIVVLLAIAFSTLFANAQPPMGGMGMGGMGMGGMGMGMGMGMGGFSQPFYITESDSIATIHINKAASELQLNEKQLKKMIKLFGQEYEEECRIIQTSILEIQMSSMGGFGRYGGGMNMPLTNTNTTPKVLDTLSVKNTYFEVGEKYYKRYGKILDDEQVIQWNKMEAERKEKDFLDLLNHISDNTESLF